jgi:signal transduction histidine kinase
MRLSQFILDNLEAILQEWENFARSLKSGHLMSTEALRNDAERMLRFVASDIESAQTSRQELAKSTGHGPELPHGQLSAAHEHGISRAVARFSPIELVAEYRALRASVTRMWIDAAPLTRETVDQIVRLNEAMDQLVAESIGQFTGRIDHDADLFTASVGHDLSNPVNTVAMSVQILAAVGNLSQSERAAVSRIERAADRLTDMLADLRDFTRTRLGTFVRVDRVQCDVGTVVRNIVDELAAVYPDRHLAVECSGNLIARVDAKRISQVASNLVANALQHGPANGQVTVRALGDVDAVILEVHNTGKAIAPARVETLFDPLSRPRTSEADDARLGLGLYIAQQIVLAHGGTIDVASTDGTGTQFTVRLPAHGTTFPPSAEK